MLGVLYRRGPLAESVHHVHVAVCDRDGRLLASAGDPGRVTYLRSAAKVFQALPLLARGGAERYGLGDAEIGVILASHTGTPSHVEVVRRVLALAEAREDDLVCGGEAPSDAEAARELARSGQRPGKLHDNCSGKHAGMLLACRMAGWPLSGYQKADHPLQREIRGAIESFAGAAGEAVIGIDGCGAPSFALPLATAVRGFARWLSPDGGPGPELARAASRARAALAARPDMVCGPGTWNTELIRVTRGRVLGKGGAEGVFLAGDAGSGTSLALKVEDGGSRAVPPATFHVLLALGLLSNDERTELAPLGRPAATNRAGEEVGEIVVEGDLVPAAGKEGRPAATAGPRRAP